MIELRAVQRTYLKASETIVALHDVTLTVRDGEPVPPMAQFRTYASA